MAAVALLAVTVIALPASMVRRFLPGSVGASDFSGSIWHGSADQVTVHGRNVGAVEWHVHPWSLLELALAADLHWVKIGFVADGSVELDSHGLVLRNLQGGGSIDDLRDLGIAAGWHGTTNFNASKIKMSLAGAAGSGGTVTLMSLVGDLTVSNLSSSQVADGADLGGYTLHAADETILRGADAPAQLTDTGGPLAVQATIRFSPDARTGMLSGTVNTRADAPPALRKQIDALAQMHARDAQGGIPVDLEFTL